MNKPSFLTYDICKAADYCNLSAEILTEHRRQGTGPVVCKCPLSGDWRYTVESLNRWLHYMQGGISA